MVTKLTDSTMIPNEEQSSENVKVVVRVRPLNDKEMSADYRNITTVDAINGTVKLDHLNQTRESPAKVFTFDTVFPMDVKQVDVYNRYYNFLFSY
jgi:hypothetical protein